MQPALVPKIITAERLDGGVVIAFDDGRTAIYSASLLHKFFSEAQELPDELED